MFTAALRHSANIAAAGLIIAVGLIGPDGIRRASELLADAVEGPQPIAVEPGSITLRADRNGHFVTLAQVNGQPVRFLIDSGASTVVLSRGDAEKLDLPLTERDFTQIFSTPGGFVRAAPIRLAEVRIGELRLQDVRAAVSEREMEISLLGTSFLDRLSGYEVRRGQMTLRW